MRGGLAVGIHVLLTLALFGGDQRETTATLRPKKGPVAPTDYGATGLDDGKEEKCPYQYSDPSSIQTVASCYPGSQMYPTDIINFSNQNVNKFL